MPVSKKRLRLLLQYTGGEERLKIILRDFYTRMSKDVLIGFFFDGKDPLAIADKQMEFLLFAMGERASYSGKLPNQAHDSLPKILSGHFDRRLTLLRQVLQDYQVDEKGIQAWVKFENAFREVIVSETQH